ncbi:MFS transporter permease [Enterovibrio norvegicus]|uniref:MFS transporter n=1 Tax=Enterovibrio norvegicus TaxID=188144 RepID=UPI000CC42D3A|nr:MFS transporter [Enterovibrio norvegicus]MCC4797273.1 MFS transporter [Enterovibrio norvegicus]PMH72310.1 MFS transporter permease [Enterovibrio norvegicus]PMI27144.1 MFS transporter permease [Enterovibrio norvegicus]PMI40206.1 MFS transporter permease [Enterovibrio norvegicus]PMN56421.1 MFS transporter permease [Enterovibrio norvegicus]
MIELNSPAYRKATFALSFGSFLVFCNLYLFQPMLPVFANTFDVTATKVNWLLAASTLGLSVSLLPWAMLSEKIGRRDVMLTSLALIPLVSIASLWAESFWTLVLLRGLMGIALAGYAAVAVAYIAEEFSPMALVMAVGGYISANSIGGISGRLAGGFLSDAFGWHGAVIGMTAFTVLGIGFVYALLPSQQHFSASNTSFRAQFSTIRSHLTNPLLLLAMMIGGINFAIFVNIYSVTAFRLVDAPFNLPVSLVSTIFICYLAGTLTSKLSGRWANRHSVFSGLLLGTGITMLGVLVASVDAISMVIVGLLIVGGGAFFTHSLAYGWVSRKAQQGKATATALYLVHYYVGGSLGGFYLIGCWEYGRWPLVTLGAMSLAAVNVLLIHLLGVREKTQTPSVVEPTIVK